PPVTDAPPSPDPERRSRRRRGLVKLAAFFLVLFGLLGGTALYVRSVAAGTAGAGAPVKIVVPEGASAGQIAELLAGKDIIDNAWIFKLFARFDGRAGSLKPGEYDMQTGMSFGEVLRTLEDGPVIRIERVTIPEGKTVGEVVDIIRTKTSISATEFKAEIDSGRHRLPIMPDNVKSLEGLLYPKTYDIREGATAGQVLKMMLDQFTDETRALDFSKAKANLTPYQVVIAASLIEREAKIDEDRPKIAQVIYNRIARGMRLQIDATVQYGYLMKTGSYKGRLTYADYELDHPYNTYRIDGLPPGPIASPRLASIVAMLEPADTDAIYYIHCDKRGGHAFAKTASEFEKLKRECPGKR
ncbi:MAG TPA: endolytic transglycosylase MltG, partial [Actinomycetota bacterium]|nr:endolytic transglycosylase MltG [Actinomycetota bacterium]